jgi:5-methylcytosine-specific restriction endonuclease McrA
MSNLIPQNEDTRKMKQERATMNKVLTDYKRHAKKKGVSWDLTDDQVKSIISKECYYCGAEPTPNYAGKINGIDAIDNNKGYTLDNIVPCCKRCNKAKWILPLEEFEDMIRDIHNHYFVKKKRARL